MAEPKPVTQPFGWPSALAALAVVAMLCATIVTVTWLLTR